MVSFKYSSSCLTSCSVLLFLRYQLPCTSLILFSHQIYKFKPKVSTEHRCVFNCIWTAVAPFFDCQSKQPWCIVHSQSLLCFVGSIAAATLWHFDVSGLIICDVIFNFSCFVYNHRLFFPCKSDVLLLFASSGHSVLRKSGLWGHFCPIN